MEGFVRRGRYVIVHVLVVRRILASSAPSSPPDAIVGTTSTRRRVVFDDVSPGIDSATAIVHVVKVLRIAHHPVDGLGGA